ncbi:MAG: hypothetical protein HUN05_08120 [Desulfobacter sp.]|nr:MAG: hypothetical protein HUN05_08120 [Desulfobacter sp.]
MSRCNRALAVAGQGDLVVLRTEFDRDYRDWLQANGLGTDRLVEYGVQSDEMTLSEMIVKNPDPILEVISTLGKDPVYVPWFSGQMEKAAADILGAKLFGSPKSLTRTYNDKVCFKRICRQLGISTIEGNSFEVVPERNENYFQFEKIVHRHLSTTHRVIVGEAGMSLYKTSGNDLPELYRQIADTGEKKFIIEPFLNVISSPNDQWIIDRSGNVHHMGIREQICERGMVYIGTLKGEPYSPAVRDSILQASMKIVTHMARSGYTGVVGIDYIITKNGTYPVENNARFNGSTYVGMIILATDIEQLHHLEKELKELGIRK